MLLLADAMPAMITMQSYSVRTHEAAEVSHGYRAYGDYLRGAGEVLAWVSGRSSDLCICCSSLDMWRCAAPAAVNKLTDPSPSHLCTDMHADNSQCGHDAGSVRRVMAGMAGHAWVMHCCRAGRVRMQLGGRLSAVLMRAWRALGMAERTGSDGGTKGAGCGLCRVGARVGVHEREQAGWDTESG